MELIKVLAKQQINFKEQGRKIEGRLVQRISMALI
jgi:hypothetical protein